MRTKALLSLAALAACAVTASAQVYSANVVGYVNKTIPAGSFVLVANQLTATGGGDLNSIIKGAPDGTQVWRWLVDVQDLDVSNVATYDAGAQMWNPNPTLNTGEAFFLVAAEDYTQTFVGEVPQNALTTVLTGNSNFEAIGATVPVGGGMANVLGGYPATDGDQIWTWNVGLQDFNVSDVSTYDGGAQVWNPDQNLAVGDGFFLVRAGGPVDYVRTFTVPQ